MKKQDIVILAVLFGLWIAWPMVDRQIKKRFFHSAPAPAAEQVVESTEPVQKPVAPVSPEVAEPAIAEAPAETPAAPAVAEEPVSTTPEKTAVLENEQLKVTVSSRGAAIASAELKNYRTGFRPTTILI